MLSIFSFIDIDWVTPLCQHWIAAAQPPAIDFAPQARLWLATPRRDVTLFQPLRLISHTLSWLRHWLRHWYHYCHMAVINKICFHWIAAHFLHLFFFWLPRWWLLIRHYHYMPLPFISLIPLSPLHTLATHISFRHWVIFTLPIIAIQFRLLRSIFSMLHYIHMPLDNIFTLFFITLSSLATLSHITPPLLLSLLSLLPLIRHYYFFHIITILIFISHVAISHYRYAFSHYLRHYFRHTD